MNTNLAPKEMLEFLKDTCESALAVHLGTPKNYAGLRKYRGREDITPDNLETAYNRLNPSEILEVRVDWDISVDEKCARFKREGNVFVPQTESTEAAVLNWREG